MKFYKKTFFIKCICSVFVLLVTICSSSCGFIVSTIFAEKERVVTDRILYVDTNGNENVRVLLGRTFKDYVILGDNASSKLKKIEFYIVQVNLTQIQDGEKNLTFKKIGELKGGDSYTFFGFFGLTTGENEIVAFANQENNNDINLCEYYSGNCVVNIIDKANFHSIAEETTTAGYEVEVTNSVFKFTTSTKVRHKKYINIYVNDKNMYDLNYDLDGYEENFDMRIYSK